MMTSIFRTSANPDPNEAMVASQQKHIAELVAQNKTLEHTLSRLRAEAAAERERTEGVRGEWAAERIEWRAGCDALQDAHRAAHCAHKSYRYEDPRRAGACGGGGGAADGPPPPRR